MEKVTVEPTEKEVRRAAMVAALGAGTDYEDGCVIEWSRLFSGNPRVFTYVAVKVLGLWYISGQVQTAHEWDGLVAKYLQYAESVWLMTASEQIA